MSSAYNPVQGSIAWRAIEFFTTHADESLSAGDIAIKFDTPAKGVHSLLGQAVASGALKREEDLKSAELVYRLGAGVPGIKPNSSAHPTLNGLDAPAVLSAAVARSRAPRFEFDPLTHPIDKDVPLQDRPKTEAWKALFDRIVEPEVDSARFPATAQSAVKKAMQEYMKAGGGKLTLKRSGDEHVRVWRAK